MVDRAPAPRYPQEGGDGVRFDRPWALVAIPVVVTVVWLIAVRGKRTVPPRQHRWAVLARAIAATLLVVAAAAPHLQRAVATPSVLLTVDRSESIGAETRAAHAAAATSGPAAAPPAA